MSQSRRASVATLARTGLVAVLALGVAGCGKSDDPAPAAGEAVTAEVDGGSTVVSFTWPPVSVEDIPPAERQDLEMIAESEGISVEEAIANFGNQQKIGEIIRQLESAFPLDYATAELDGENGGRIWFIGAPPPEALRIIEGAAETVSVDAGPERLFSDYELGRATERVNEVAMELLPDGMSGAGAEPTEGVVVHVFDLGGMTAEALRNRILADPRVEPLGIPVVIDFDPRNRMSGGDS